MINQNNIFKFGCNMGISLFHHGSSIFKVRKHFFFTSISFNNNEEKRRAKAWEEKLRREAEPDPDEVDPNTTLLKKFDSKRKPLSAEVSSLFQNLPLPFRWDWDIIKSIYKHVKKRSLYYDQRYIDQRVEILGYDLAAAHFIVHRGGKIRFKGTTDWVVRNEDEEYSLPSKYTPHYIVEALDATGLPIVYDGLLNIENLYHMKWLSFSRCPNFNDWCLDRICDQNYRSLIYLDISHCSLITENGLTTLAKLQTLKTIDVSGLGHLKNLKLICLLLQDAIPNLTVDGLSID